MNAEEIREYCLSKKGVTDGFPFDETSLVFKVAGKMFAIYDLEGQYGINLKCDPNRAIELREQYPDLIIPGYHMNKQHWNSVKTDDRLPWGLIKDLIDHSYDLIVKKFTKKEKEFYNTF